MESGDCKLMCSHDQKCRKRRSILWIWGGLGFNKEVIIHIETFISKVQISKQLSVQWVEWKLPDQWRQNQEIKGGVISTKWPNKMAITVSLSSTTIFGIHPWTKVPLWELWDPEPYSKDSRGVSLSHVTGNGQTDLGPSCGPWMGQGPSSLSCDPGAPGEH